MNKTTNHWHMRRKLRKRQHRAFTLLELMLSLMLTTILLGALGFAVHVHLRATLGGRAEVAQAQVARAVLRQISDDLRGAIWYQPVDVEQAVSGASGAAAAMAGAASSGSSPAAGGSGGGSGSTGGASSSGGSSSSRNGGQSSGGSTASGTTSPSGASGGTTSSGSSSGGSMGSSGSSAAPSASSSNSGSSTGGSSSSVTDAGGEVVDPDALPTMPGVYGGTDWLEVDVSRLPRIDQFDQAQQANGVLDHLSDLKTVAYFVNTGRGASAGAGTEIGLMRREAGRAVTQWAYENGQSSDQNRAAQLLAPEIVAVEFRYFDGTTWVSEWNSTDAGGLPSAIEVSIAVATEAALAEGVVLNGPLSTGTASSTQSSPGTGVAVYRLVVSLPLHVTPSTTATSATDGSTGSTGTNSTGASTTK